MWFWFEDYGKWKLHIFLFNNSPSRSFHLLFLKTSFFTTPLLALFIFCFLHFLFHNFPSRSFHLLFLYQSLSQWALLIISVYEVRFLLFLSLSLFAHVLNFSVELKLLNAWVFLSLLPLIFPLTWIPGRTKMNPWMLPILNFTISLFSVQS